VLGPTQAFHDKTCTEPDRVSVMFYQNKIYSAVETTTKLAQKAKYQQDYIEIRIEKGYILFVL